MSKGKRRERQADDIYADAGYVTFRPPRTKYDETDIFGLFDLLAIGHGHVRLIQVKGTSSNVAYGPWFEAVKGWVHDNVRRPPRSLVHDFVICYDREGWRLIGEGGDGPETFVDERELDCNMGDGLREYLRP